MRPVIECLAPPVKIELTAKEYALLEYLARRAGQLVSRADIAAHVWDESFDPFSNTIEVYVNRLRKKIDEQHTVKLIHTRRGEGYILEPRTTILTFTFRSGYRPLRFVD